MTQPKQLQHIVSVKAGSAAGRSLKFELPAKDLHGKQGLLGYTVEKIVEYGLNQQVTRQQQPIAEAIRREMRATSYGITANTSAATRNSIVSDLFVEKEVTGQKYMSLDLVVASQQTGGNYR